MEPADAAARLRGNRKDPSAPISVSARRSHHRARNGQADRRHQEHLVQRAVPFAVAVGPARPAADDSDRGDRAGRRDPDSGEAREPGEAAFLRGHRARAVIAGRCIRATWWSSR